MSIVDAYRQIVPTPPEHRTWIDERTALRVLGCGPDELAALKDVGLATSEEGVERYDVWNVGMAEGVQRSRGEREMVFFNRLLRSYGGDWTSAFDYDASAVAVCRGGEGCPGGSWPALPAVPGVDWQGLTVERHRAEWHGTVTMSGRAGTVRSPRIEARWRGLLASYGFHFATLPLASDIEATRARGVGDCTALSIVLADELRADGYEARVGRGYIFGGARTRWHRWVEVVDDDGEVKYLDPSMALLAERFFSAEYAAFCFGSLLNRIVPVDDDEQFYVRHRCDLVDDRAYLDLGLRPR